MAIIIREYEPQDAAAVARLYQASDPAWPDGFSDGLLYPADVIQRDVEGEKALNTYLAWADDKVVGFADIFDIPGQEKAAYLGLLNSDPAYHGRGVGRDLILKCIERCVELGYTRLHLETWQGNTRAVPLYKKTGFYWGPENTDWDELQNYVPFLVTHPLTKPYFDRTPWYSAMQRELKLGLDDEKRNGALVFPYLFEGDAGTLRAVFDQKSKKLVELETPELLLSLATPRFEMVRGTEQTATLEVENRREEPLTVAVSAKGEDSVSATHYEVVSVGPGERRAVGIAVKTDDEKTGNGSVQLSLLAGGHALEMAGTLKVVPQLELGLEPASPPLRPGVAETVTLNLRNRLEEPMEVALLASASGALAATLPDKEIQLEPGAVRGIGFPVAAAEAGAYQLLVSPRITVGGKTDLLPALKADMAAAGTGDVVVARGEGTAVYTEHFTLSLPKKGTGHTLSERRTGMSLTGTWLTAGPPYWPPALSEQEAEVAVRESPGKAVVTLTQSFPEPKGLRFERTYTVHADGRVGVSYGLRNLGGEERELRVRQGLWGPENRRADCVPLAEGVVRGQGGMPGWKWDGPGADTPFAARWSAVEGDPWTIGFLWPEEFKARSGGWNSVSLETPLARLAPGESRAFPEITLLPTLGGWEAVEREWQTRQGLEPRTSPELPAAGARVAPSPVVMLGDAATAQVEARSLVPRRSDGAVRVSASEGFSVVPESLSFQGVNVVSQPTEEITIAREAREPGTGEIALDASFPYARGRFTAPVIALGSADGAVRVEQAEDQGETVWRVENGWLSFGVRPSVLGSVYTLASPAGEQLYASFPEPRARHWGYPVYGGIQPILWERGGWHYDNLGRLQGLTLRAEPAEREGERGITWRGVRLWADLEHEALLGLRFEIAYLTVPGSNVLAIATALRSSGPARAVRLALQVSPVKMPETPAIVLPDQSAYARAALRGDATLRGGRWVSVEYASDGRTLALVGTPGGEVEAEDMGAEGSVLTGTWQTTVPCGGERETLNYVALAADRRQGALYASLGDSGGL